MSITERSLVETGAPTDLFFDDKERLLVSIFNEMCTSVSPNGHGRFSDSDCSAMGANIRAARLLCEQQDIVYGNKDGIVEVPAQDHRGFTYILSDFIYFSVRDTPSVNTVAHYEFGDIDWNNPGAYRYFDSKGDKLQPYARFNRFLTKTIIDRSFNFEDKNIDTVNYHFSHKDLLLDRKFGSVVELS